MRTGYPWHRRSALNLTLTLTLALTLALTPNGGIFFPTEYENGLPVATQVRVRVRASV